MNFRVVANNRVVIDRNVGMNLNALANLYIFPDDCMRAYENVGRNARGWIDDRGRMNRGVEGGPGMKQAQRASKSKIRIFRAQDRDICARNFDVFAQIDG